MSDAIIAKPNVFLLEKMNHQINQIMEATEKMADLFRTRSCKRDVNRSFEEFGTDLEARPIEKVSNDEPEKIEEQQELAVNLLRYAIVFVFMIETFEITVRGIKVHEFNFDRVLLCLTLVIFAIYDRSVARRYNVPNTTAAQSSIAIASAFPEHIRARFCDYHDHAQGLVNDVIPVQKDSLLISDAYPACSLMFADIVGYTEWSSKHQPEDSMQLLETLYGSFDDIARKYNVFKVETVGDCYVAATGLPNAQDDHALILTMFATECTFKIKKVLKSLGDELGTANLSMRFGVHSGPVTAGILRGGNPRFQLFGDTVNTTARIETNGEPGRIHISQSTATFLIESGKANWVIEREGLVHAKGKGFMQTYWVDLLQVAPHIIKRERMTC